VSSTVTRKAVPRIPDRGRDLAADRAAIPPVPNEQLLDAYRKGQADLRALGITALTEPGLGPGHQALLDGSGSIEALDSLADLAEAGDLTMRVSVLVLPNGTGGANAADVRKHLETGLARRYDNRDLDPRRLTIAGVKVFADGTPQNGTTWHKEPVYEGNPPEHRCGHMVVAGESDVDKVEELREIIRTVDAAGLQVAIHAIGDQTVETVIDTIAEVAAHSPLRHYLIHTTELYPHGWETLAANGIGACFNPSSSAPLPSSCQGNECYEPSRSARRSTPASVRASPPTPPWCRRIGAPPSSTP
jgi:predicted amidohydrolase YtcJ